MKSGEDHLFSAERFILVNLPQGVEISLLNKLNQPALIQTDHC
ncbi:hypothetical protein BH18ACI3_BH18ACI3_04610 [soil metagenome]